MMDATETMFLTREEIAELTDYKRSADQIRCLRDHGYRFDVGASGRPKVLRSVIEQRLGTRAKSKANEPCFDLVNA